MKRLGIDLGGTKIEGLVLDEKNQPLKRKRIPTPSDNYDDILTAITSLAGELKPSDASVGVCTPGALSARTGLIKNSNTNCLIGRPLQKDLSAALGQEVALENDANCFAMAEATMGAGVGYSMVFGVIMGTGVGGGIVIDGKIHHGRTDIAGEWGHHILHSGGNACYCGSRGCVETYISGPALEKRWLEITGKTMPLKEAVRCTDTHAGRAWKTEFLDNFGIAMGNVIDILDPDAIVLGGGLSNVPFLYDEGKKRVYESVFTDAVDTPILQNALGDSAGVYGAALLET